jgi:hypothetical protein
MTVSHESAAEQALREAGWRPGRRVSPERVREWEAALAADGFALHAAAEPVLSEYGGLHVGRVGPGVECAASDVDLNPVLAVGERDRFARLLPEPHGRSAYPLGEAHHGHAFLCISATGEVFAFMDEVFARWPSFGAALRDLVVGLRPPAV